MSAAKEGKNDAWMPLWIGAYLADTMRLTTIQHGAYLLLLIAYWRERAPLLDDDEELRSITKLERAEWKRMRPVLVKFFRVADGVWWHKRVEHEIAQSDVRSKFATTKSAAGGSARWESDDASERGRHLRSQRMSEARAKATHTPLEWEAMKLHHGNQCVRCGAGDRPMFKDHIKPIYQGGSDGIENLQPLCQKCNCSKGPDAYDHRKPDWKDAIQNAFPEGNSVGNQSLPAAYPTQTHSSGTSVPGGKPPADMTKAELWSAGRSILMQANMPEAQCRSFIGKLAKDYGNEVAVEAVRSAIVEQPADPVAYLKACCQRSVGERKLPHVERTAGFFADDDAPKQSTTGARHVSSPADVIDIDSRRVG